MDFPAIFGALCAPAALRPLGDVPLLGLFLAGLSGSVLHCAPMCGPFVLGQMATRMARMPRGAMCELHRLRGAALLPYHLGRLVTYAGLGALAGGIGAGLGRLDWFGPLSGVLLAFAALIFLGHALRRLSPAAARRLPAVDMPILPAWAPRGLARLSGVAARGGSFPLGLLLGFLPCGLLYAALAVAAAGPGPAAGALAMLAFGLGTVPALVGVALLGNRAITGLGALGRPGSPWRTRLAPAVLAANAVLLAVLAFQRLVA